MSTAPSYHDARPRLRPEVALGPGLNAGTNVLHHVKDRRTGWFFRVGPREFFVISRLDGHRSLAEIGEEYYHEFGRRLGQRSWQQILGLLAQRRLLTGTEDPSEMDRLAEACRTASRGRRSLLLLRVPLISPDRLFDRVVGPTRFLFSAYFVVPALLSVLALAALAGWRGATVLGETRAALAEPPILAAGVILVWLTVALHECAHGMTCKHFGGQAPEIGIIWRFPLLVPYCKADDVVLFARRRERVYTAAAGIFAQLVVLIPFGVLWALAPVGSAAGRLSAMVILVGAAFVVGNSIPFLQLDGYFMLNHALGMVNLRSESYRFWGRILNRLIRRGPGIGEYRSGARVAYVCYGFVSMVYGLFLLTRVVFLFYLWVYLRLGPMGTILLLVGLGMLGAIGALARIWLRRRRPTRVAGPVFTEPVRPNAVVTGGVGTDAGA